jgi:hypothetical protein
MATTTTNTAPDNSTDANFRAWGSGVSAALATLGLIQTGDTGQINWTTVTHPTLTNTSQGYEIWRLNDALQSTAPFFLKLEYGSGAGANQPGIWITTGTGSNGAGSLTNPSTRFQIASNTNSLTTFTSFFAGDSGGFAMMLFGTATTNSQPVFFCIDRSKSVTGSDTGTYLSVTWSASQNTSNNVGFFMHLANGTTVVETSNGTGANIPGPLTTLSNTQASGNIALIPVLPCLGFFNYPLRRVISGKAQDWTNGDTPAISLYPGITDSYLVFKVGAVASTGTWIFGPAGTNSVPMGQGYCIIMRNQ